MQVSVTNPAAAVVTSARNLAFNGTAFTLGSVEVSATGALQNRTLFFAINRRNSSGGLINTHTGNVTVGASGTISPNAGVNTINNGEQIEIRIYLDSSRSNLLSRQIVNQAVFSF